MAENDEKDEKDETDLAAEADAPARHEASEATPEQVEAAEQFAETASEADEPGDLLVPTQDDEGRGTDPAAAAAESAGTTGAGDVPAAAQQPSGPKPKRKRLPRPLRRQRSKPKREQPAARRPITRLPKPEHERANRQERQGTVVSAAMEKTIVVKVDVIKAHPKYKKVVRRSAKFHAHDERNEAKVGDVVRIIETRPLSKQKRWRLAEIVEAAK
jgi:small subunit ribosomal protein S17